MYPINTPQEESTKPTEPHKVSSVVCTMYEPGTCKNSHFLGKGVKS